MSVCDATDTKFFVSREQEPAADLWSYCDRPPEPCEEIAAAIVPPCWGDSRKTTTGPRQVPVLGRRKTSYLWRHIRNIPS